MVSLSTINGQHKRWEIPPDRQASLPQRRIRQQVRGTRLRAGHRHPTSEVERYNVQHRGNEVVGFVESPCQVSALMQYMLLPQGHESPYAPGV